MIELIELVELVEIFEVVELDEPAELLCEHWANCDHQDQGF